MADGRVKDHFAAYGVKYKAGSKRQRRDESNEAFVARVQKTFPAVIKQLRGCIETAALAYSIEDGLLRAFVAKNLKCKTALTKAISDEVARMASGKDGDDLPRSNEGDATDRDSRTKRVNWSTDPDQKEEDAHDLLLVSIIENEGNIIEASKCLNLDTTYILGLLDEYEDLYEAKERGMRIAVLQSEAKLAEQAKGGNLTAIKLILTNKAQDEWSDRQSMTVKHEGFSPPAEETGGSVLSIVKGGKK